MRICFVCGEYPPGRHGGIGSMVQTLGRALAAAGHHVRVVGIYAGRSERVDEDDHGVLVSRLAEPNGALSGPRARWALYRHVAALARDGVVDLVEVPDYQGWAAYWPALPVPVVARLNGSSSYFAVEMGRTPRRSAWHFEGRSLRRTDGVCSVSRYTAERTRALFDLGRPADAILPNPVAPAGAAAWSERDPHTVVFSGTLTPKKGVEPLMTAWPAVLAGVPEARLHVFGKDGETTAGESMRRVLEARLGAAAASVTFHGHVTREEVAAALGRARAAVFPSFAEAFAIAPLEAMATGCPTIGSALGSGPELITHGVDGLTVNPGRPSEIAEAITRLLTCEADARAYGDRGRATIEGQFTVDRLLDRNIDFYRACIDRHAAASVGRRTVVRTAAGGASPRG
ncbi:MAG: glycosyltransferase family 4 protein [Acidobacteria bacterium]|nr:glycosyltransferase family 4 protein [Acidobacteriota bacterium]